MSKLVDLEEARRTATPDGFIWGEATKLPKLHSEAPTLHDDMLPEALRGWLAVVAERTQIPLECVAAPAVVSLSSVIGRTIGVKPKRRDDWLVVPNLWGGVVGRPGMMKTPALSEALSPLHRLDAEARETHKSSSANAQATKEVNLAKQAAVKAGIKKAAESSDPAAEEQNRRDLARLIEEAETLESHQRRYITNDATKEKVGEVLAHNPRGILIMRDELSGWLKGLDRQGSEGDREFFLEGWNGTGSYVVDRIGRGTIHVPALCLSIVGGIQPGKLKTYVESAIAGGGGDDGLLQRFQLLVWPDGLGQWRNVDRFPDHDAKQQALEVFTRLDRMAESLELPTEGFDPIPALHFATDAQELFDEWRNDLELRLRSSEVESCPAFEAQIAKYRSLMPSLALIFALVEEPEVPAAIALQHTRRAAAWVDFLEGHHRKLFASEVNPELSSAHRLAEKIASSSIEDGMSLREIYRNHWSGLDRPDAVVAGIKLLAKHNIARLMVQHDTGGRPSDRIHLHPQAMRAVR